MAKDDYYFKHDQSARNDPKSRALIKKYGMEGYGRYWVIIEELRMARGYKLEDKTYIWLSLAEQMSTSVEQVKEFVKDCVEEFELFTQDNGYFYSSSLLEKMIKLDDIRSKRSEAGSWDRDR